MEKLRTDPKAKLIHSLRARFHAAFKAKKVVKPGHTLTLLGCSIAELKQRLELKFKPGMNWDNYGAWHVDHIVPMADINMADQASVLTICNYKNLQPLWAAENLAKGSRKERVQS